MAFPTLDVKDGNGILQSRNTLPNAGPVVAAESLPVALATDQLGAQGTGLNPPAGGSGLLGFLSGIFDRIGSAVTSLAALVAGTSKLPFLAIAVNSVTSATNLFSTACDGYATLIVQVTSAGSSCTVTYEGSIDGTNWVVLWMQNAAFANSTSTSTSTGIFRFDIGGLSFVRARVSTYGSGTVTAQAALSAGLSAQKSVALAASTSNIGVVSLAPVIYADTTTPLASGATFASAGRDGGSSPLYTTFAATFVSDQASASSGAKIQASNDNSTWLNAAVVTLAANVPQTLSVPAVARYYRVVLINGATLQGNLMINSGYFRT